MNFAQLRDQLEEKFVGGRASDWPLGCYIWHDEETDLICWQDYDPIFALLLIGKPDAEDLAVLGFDRDDFEIDQGAIIPPPKRYNVGLRPVNEKV